MATYGRLPRWELGAYCSLCSTASETVLVTPGCSASPVFIFLDCICSFVSLLCLCVCLMRFSFWIRSYKVIKYVGNWQPHKLGWMVVVLCHWWVILMGIPLFLRCPLSARGPSTPLSSHWRSACPSGPRMLCCQPGHGKGFPASVPGSLTQRPLLLRAWPWAYFLIWPWCCCPPQYPVYTETSLAVSVVDWTAELWERGSNQVPMILSDPFYPSLPCSSSPWPIDKHRPVVLWKGCILHLPDHILMGLLS